MRSLAHSFQAARLPLSLAVLVFLDASVISFGFFSTKKTLCACVLFSCSLFLSLQARMLFEEHAAHREYALDQQLPDSSQQQCRSTDTS
jgi:hypothetical protein